LFRIYQGRIKASASQVLSCAIRYSPLQIRNQITALNAFLAFLGFTRQ